MYGAIRRITGSVFLVILAHTLSNTLAVDGMFLNNWTGIILSTAVFVLGSTIAVYIHDKKQYI
jgi:hypothetical protein